MAAVLAFGILTVPVLPLFCGGSGQAEMSACCREMADRCNRSGMNDNCCRTAPGSDDGTPAAAKAERLTKVDRATVFAPAILVAANVGALDVFQVRPFRMPAMALAADTSPPSTSVLRV